MKPASAVPAPTGQQNPKSGTTIVKSAPPKETARITVKPNLPATAVKAGGNFPTAKPAVAGAAPVAAAAAVGAAAGAVAAKVAAKPAVGNKPATTIVKGSTAKVVAAPKPAAASASGTVPVPAMPASYAEEGSTTLTTALAGVLAVATWGTAGLLFASYFGVI
jgi:hypothetical protein